MGDRGARSGGNAFLLQLSDALQTLDDPVEVQAAAARLLGVHIGANRVFYADIADEKEAVIHSDFVDGVESLQGRHTIALFGCDAAVRLRRGETLTLSDSVVVGVVDNDRWVAAFGAHSAAPRVWSESEVRLTEETAHRTWAAVERARAGQAIRAALAEKKALLKEVHHRAKNHLQLIASLINLQANQEADNRVLALLDATLSRVHSIATVYDLMCRWEGDAGIDIAAYTGQLVPVLARLHDAGPEVQVRIVGVGAPLDMERAVSFGLLLNELLSNSLRHAFPAGRAGEVTIHIGQEGDDNVLTVADNGAGFPAGFDYHRASSLGLMLVQMLSQQLRGAVDVMPGTGARIRVRFPTAH